MLNKKMNLHKWNFAALLLTITLFMSVVHLTVDIPKKYEEYQYEYIENVKKEIESTLGNENMPDNIINIRNDYDFDVIVISNDRLIYTSNGLYDFENASEIVNTGYISQEVYEYEDYSIWLTVYNIDVKGFVYEILIQIAILSILQLISLIIIMTVLLRRAINPLRRLSDIILMLKNDKKIIDMDEQIDEISAELIKVSNDLKLRLYSNNKEKDEYHRRYNLQNKLLYEQKKYLSSVVHDVKSAFLAIKFSSDCLKESEKFIEDDVDARAIKSIETSSVKALEFITESLDNVINDSYSIYITKSEIKVKYLIEEYFTINKFLLLEKQLKLNVVGDEKIIFENLIKFNQLMNNILSNMINNALEATTLEIKISDNMITFENEVKNQPSLYSNSYGMRIINESLEGTTYKYEFNTKNNVAIGMLFEVSENVK